jgi:hypothetical protein
MTRLPASPDRSAAVLNVKVYGEDGSLLNAGAWMLDADGKWERCAA